MLWFWLTEALPVGIASTLFARCLFWHVPKLALMIRRGWIDAHRAERDANPEEPVQVAAPIDMDLWEAKLFIDNTTAFWLEPSRWDRPTWPATPVISDLRRDGSVNDKILAFAMLTGPERLSLAEQRDLTGLWQPGTPSISSKRNFDRRY
jgi:hypothetical protein